MHKELKQKLLPLYQKFEQEDIKRLSVFNIQVGSCWVKRKGILFVGKATNGWKDNSISELFSEYDENEDVLSWVEEHKGNKEYNSRRSSFWRVIEKISQKEFSNSIWYKNIVWSNLCKLAPRGKGNPTNKDFYKQKDICKEILLTEIEILQPKVIVLFTSDWDILGIKEPITNGFEKISQEKWSGDKYTSVLYKYKDTYYIDSYHPQGKLESEHITAICKLIDNIK